MNHGEPCFDSDEDLLESLEHKLQLIRDRVQGVAEGYGNGFFLWGEGGTSKSFTVEETLRKLGKAFKLTNSRVTGRGLFKLLCEFPDVVHVLEDVETLFRDRNAHGVLRSALWGQLGRDGRQERLVTWQTVDGREEFVFTGGVILVANCNLDDVPQLRALKTRIPSLHYQPTNEEIGARMRELARRGHAHGPHSLSPEMCLEVAREVIVRSFRLNRGLDLRLLVNAFQDRLQYENGAAETHWVDLLDSRLRERVVVPPGGAGVRGKRKEWEFAVLRRIANLPTQERLDVWKQETGKSQAAMYRRLDEMKCRELSISHPQ